MLAIDLDISQAEIQTFMIHKSRKYVPTPKVVAGRNSHF
jgi:hypothetical protein